MGVLIYTAKRNIIPGHVNGTQYSIDNDFWQSESETKKKSSKAEMMDGTFEEELDYLVDEIRLLTDIVTEDDLPLWKEFFRSVAVNEQFQIDLTGAAANPDNPQNCVIVSGGYKPVRVQDGVQLYKFSFTVRIL